MSARSLNDVVAEIVANDTIVTWEGVRHACRLLLAYADYNSAASDAKRTPQTANQRQLIAAMMATLEELKTFHEDCERSWVAYQAAEWPRGAVDVWEANDAAFCAELKRYTRTLETMAAKHFGEALASKHFGERRER